MICVHCGKEIQDNAAVTRKIETYNHQDNLISNANA